MNRPLILLSLLTLGCGSASEARSRDPIPVHQSSVGPDTAEQTEAPEPPDSGEPDLSPMSVQAPADVAAPPADAEVSPSGLATRVLRPGTGTRHPVATDDVTVHYTGWSTDGERFDSSVVRGSPATFPLNGVIAGWTEGVQLMVEGERRRLWIPEALAYQGRPNRPAGMLVFDVELISIAP